MVNMNAKRLLKHLVTTNGQMKAAFSPATLHDIEAAIRASETEHSGEVRFAVETALDPIALIRGETPRARAVELFSNLRIWDTEHNCGLLIYVLLADRAVEIVADRGIHAKVGEAEWVRICQQIEEAFRRNDFRSGAVSGIKSVTQHLKAHFPASIGDHNELSDRPVVLS
jgi:uncharacterized membrane protein